MAVVVLRDELPDTDVLYLRQTVLSRFAVDRLVEDTTSAYDKDIIRAFPTTVPLRAISPQEPSLHKELHTSVYLLVDHAQPFGLGHPLEVRGLENPNPRQFVAAYDVDSYFLDEDIGRLTGRNAGSSEWTPDIREHYLAMPDDPRYRKLSDSIVRDMDPRFVGDDLMKALVLKRYLEKNGFYSLPQKTLVGADPTAKFLFGDLKGYCVHFAHAMAFLARSQGIPSRVALGYAVQTKRRGAGSSLLVFGNEAHAWPEIYLDGVGWVTFDVYPEKSDEPPPTPVDGDLESMLGELARKDKTGGKAGDPNDALRDAVDRDRFVARRTARRRDRRRVRDQARPRPAPIIAEARLSRHARSAERPRLSARDRRDSRASCGTRRRHRTELRSTHEHSPARGAGWQVRTATRVSRSSHARRATELAARTSFMRRLRAAFNPTRLVVHSLGDAHGHCCRSTSHHPLVATLDDARACARRFARG